MVEPVSISALGLTVLAVISYVGKKIIGRNNIKSNCGVEFGQVITDTKNEIITELKLHIENILKEKIEKLNHKDNEKINVEREVTNV